jgi:quercetin dioxygenase-like cupin family protein
MADVTVRRTEDFEAAFRGGFIKARAGLGVTSFGMQILRFPPHADGHPEHDHSANGEEEVYTVLEGEITLHAGGEEHALAPGTFARVGPDETRKLVTGESGAVVLALGGIPGEPFEIAGFTEPSEPDANGGG